MNVAIFLAMKTQDANSARHTVSKGEKLFMVIEYTGRPLPPAAVRHENTKKRKHVVEKHDSARKA